MRNDWQILLLAAALILFAVYGADAATIVARQGAVRISPARGAPWQELGDSRELSAGAAVSTGDSASLTVRVLNRSTITVGPRSVARFDGERFAIARCTIFEGALRARVERLGGQHFQVTTALASIGVRGTEFTVSVAPGGDLVVAVDTGLVAAQHSGDSALIAAGEVLAADPFSGFHPVTAAATADLDAWRALQQQLLRDNPDSVTEKFRPFVWRELARIRLTFDDILALYRFQAELLAREQGDTPAALHYQGITDALRAAAIPVYDRVLEGRARMEAAEYTVGRLKELYGTPADWIDEGLTAYRGMWENWLVMLETFFTTADQYEQLARDQTPGTQP